MSEVSTFQTTIDPDPKGMTDREIAEETLIHLRNQRDVVTGLIGQIMESPLGAMMGKGGNSPFSVMGR